MNQNLPDRSQVLGQIYLMRNIKENKCYVGQTVTHRKNRGVYKPFGIEGRFKDHISEAICNTKKKQCNYLNNSIRLHGSDSFTVELLETCPLDQLDEREQHFIQFHSTLFPNGYNLTIGGRTFRTVEPSDIPAANPANLARQRGGCSHRTEETRKKMSKSLKQAFGDETVRKELSARTQSQHEQQRLDRFRGLQFDTTNLDKYIHERNSKVHGPYIKVIVNKQTASFFGRFEDIQTLRVRAQNFLSQIATLSNCSGKS
jgi:group I intron endonuclease